MTWPKKALWYSWLWFLANVLLTAAIAFNVHPSQHPPGRLARVGVAIAVILTTDWGMIWAHCWVQLRKKPPPS
jgi:hypothetical protein